MNIITKSSDLADYCASLADAPYVALDTEFMRETTYWPILCLVQANDGRNAVVIDALAPDMDLAPLDALMERRDIVKVFHSARQDLEIFHHRSGRVPSPVYDTQIAAMACGFGDSPSYQLLAQRIAGVALDKSARATKWHKRPLSQEQISYALHDVIHLAAIYEHLTARLAEMGRESWIEEPMTALLDPSLYDLAPDMAWRRARFSVSGKKRTRALMAAAAWREAEAQARNVPRGRVLRDDALREVIARVPTTVAGLEEARGVSSQFARSKSAARLLRALKDSASLEPPKERRKPAVSLAALEMMRLLLKAQSENHGVAPRLIAANGDLERILSGATDGVAALEGWRREIFGAEALALLKGDISLTLEGGAVRLLRQSGQSGLSALEKEEASDAP